MSEIDFLAEARRVFDIEIEALNKTRDSLDGDFCKLVELALNCKGKFILTGIGKPGHIAGKMAATLASLGTPSFFLHPAEAMHGDLGMVEKDDVVVIASYSGQSEEVLRLIPVFKEIGCVTVAVTGNPKSTLARECQYHLFFPQFDEACYMNLAPTSSTTALLVLGDALAVACAKARHFSKEDFGRHHPAGSLGKKLLVRVGDMMHSGDDNAVIRTGSSMREAIVEMSAKGLGMVSVVDKDNHIHGILTDGDLRRMLERGVDVYNETVDNVMTRNPKVIGVRDMAVDALQLMSEKEITCLPVLDLDSKVVGCIQFQDIVRAGIS